MTKTHALKKLLEHGALTPEQMVRITGWKQQEVIATIRALQASDVVRAVNLDGRQHYGLAEVDEVLR